MKSFSELTSASQVNNGDLLAISQTSGNDYASKKTTVKDITDKSNLNLAEEYDSTSTYAVDDYVIYESVLYKCIASTTGAFDSTKWTSVVVTNEMGSGGGGGTGGHTIIDENGTSMTARAGLQFVGGVNVLDDVTNNKTIVDISGGGVVETIIEDTVPAYGTNGTIAYPDGYNKDNTYVLSVMWDINRQGVIGTDRGISVELLDNNIRTYNGFNSQSAGADLYILIAKYVEESGDYYAPVIYSTEEREIGVWTDGKPLYQKSYVGIDISVSYNSWGSSGITLSNVDTIVKAFGTATDGSFQGDIMAWNDSGDLKLQTGRNGRDSNVDLLTIQYTKTTDVAGSGTWTPQGVPAHHYSTDEQVIGTWNGETLYERMFEVSHTFTQGDNDIELQSNVDFVSSDIKTYDVTTVLSNGYATKRVSALPDDTLYVNSSNKLIMYFSCTNASVGTRTVRVVAQYTKSS